MGRAMVGRNDVRPGRPPSNVISATKAASSRASSSLRSGNGPSEVTSTVAPEVPIGLCDRCGSIDWNQEAEALIEEAVRREGSSMDMAEKEWQMSARRAGGISKQEGGL